MIWCCVVSWIESRPHYSTIFVYNVWFRLSHGPATDDWWVVESLGRRSCRQWMSPHLFARHNRISGENNWSHYNHNATQRMTHFTCHCQLPHGSGSVVTRLSCRVFCVAGSSHTTTSRWSPPVFTYFANLVTRFYMIIINNMCLCVVRCVVLQWGRKCFCSYCQFRK